MKKLRVVVYCTVLILIGFQMKAHAATAPKGISFDQLKQRVFRTLPGIDGWCSAEKAETVMELLNTTYQEKRQNLREPNEVVELNVVELGTYAGRFTFCVATTLKYLRCGKVFTIDPWNNAECIRYLDPNKDKTNLEWWRKVDLEQMYKAYQNLMKKYGLEKQVVTLRMRSEEAVSHIPDGIDLLYIDGNRSELVALQDVQLYLPKVREGGFILINDATWDQIKPAVKQVAEECSEIKSIDNGNCLVFQKRAIERL